MYLFLNFIFTTLRIFALQLQKFPTIKQQIFIDSSSRSSQFSHFIRSFVDKRRIQASTWSPSLWIVKEEEWKG